MKSIFGLHSLVLLSFLQDSPELLGGDTAIASLVVTTQDPVGLLLVNTLRHLFVEQEDFFSVLGKRSLDATNSLD